MNPDLIAYRLQRSMDSLTDAKMLFAESRLLATVNRAYYAMFYAVSALLMTRELSSAKHSGVRALFNQHFVKNGLIRVEVGRLYAEVFDLRQKSDYADFVQLDVSEVGCMVQDVEIALHEIHALTLAQHETDQK